jgi:aryl-alcohol dehydrogenase (NADP+)
MDYVNLGHTGLKVSRICLGTMTYGSRKWREWVLEEEESLPFIRRALELGINFFDTADMYSLGRSEEILGRALKEFGPERERVVVATKLFQPMSDDPNQRGLSRKHIHHAVDNSLRRLQLDYIDLYQIHRFDPHTPIEETIEALSELVDAGKVLYLGASSMWAWQFATMLHTADQLGAHRFATMQNHYNLLYREEEREMMPLCETEGIGVIPWSPLARGVLTGNRQARTTRATTDDYATKLYQSTAEADARVVDDLVAVAKKRGVPPAQVALAWLLHQPAVVAPIVGASKMPHLEDAVKGEALKLSGEEIKQLEKSYVPHAVAGHE